MVQSGPKYPAKADGHPEITNYLKKKYGDNLVWPILWHYRNNLTIHSVGYEVNEKNNTNLYINSNHSIIKEMNNDYVYTYDFTSEPKKLNPLKNKYIFKYPQKAINECMNSYEYVSNNSLNTTGISTIDIDYLWMDNEGKVKGLEVTTLFMPMYSKERAIELLKSIIEKRFSKRGAYHLDLITKAAEEIFNAKLIFVCVNNEVGKNNVLQDSNVLWFELDSQQAREIHEGIIPENTKLVFEDFESFLSKL